MTQDEAQGLIGKLVRSSGHRGNWHHFPARVVGVGKKSAVVVPFKHGRSESVPFSRIRLWKAGNATAEDRRNGYRQNI